MVYMLISPVIAALSFFFFNDTATTEIYTLSLHDALPISTAEESSPPERKAPNGTSDSRWLPTASARRSRRRSTTSPSSPPDRKSTRLNSSHANISYAVFCLKKKKSPEQTV